MNNVTKESFRWVIVFGCGGFGIYGFLTSLYFMFSRPDADWFFVLAFVPTLLLAFGPFVLTAYFCWRRHYRDIFTMLSGVLAIMVFLILASLPKRIGFDHWLYSAAENDLEHLWLLLVMLVADLSCLIVPFYAAWKVFRFGVHLANKLFPAPSPAMLPI